MCHVLYLSQKARPSKKGVAILRRNPRGIVSLKSSQVGIKNTTIRNTMIRKQLSHTSLLYRTRLTGFDQYDFVVLYCSLAKSSLQMHWELLILYFIDTLFYFYFTSFYFTSFYYALLCFALLYFTIAQS